MFVLPANNRILVFPNQFPPCSVIAGGKPLFIYCEERVGNEMFYQQVSGVLLVILFFNKNRSTQRDMDIFGALCSVDQL